MASVAFGLRDFEMLLAPLRESEQLKKKPYRLTEEGKAKRLAKLSARYEELRATFDKILSGMSPGMPVQIYTLQINHGCDRLLVVKWIEDNVEAGKITLRKRGKFNKYFKSEAKLEREGK